ncbi:uncharacterized protein DUF3299 [Acidovorax delafieldii]|uniref:Uncharacterized protein DUF3299 n=1 Tax=Acidovorax delafieldii TaxID=47920 RepID=A0A561XPX1_ACIDE|nr:MULTISPECIES: DUF3299 domain-containing protein [Acidovorax]MBL7090976.1 DUF3299 domain-containing protein [Acidovorax sp.]TWG38155.1 uncharacterized protein DUF3299 [Acidovorax delafieldii]
MSCTLKPLPIPGLMARVACLAATLVLATGAHAQQGGATKPAPGAFERAKEGAAAAPVLSSPLPAGAGTVVPSGSGAGYHSPNSPIAPLPQRNDVVPWSVLTDLSKKTTKDGILPVFNDAQKGMDKTTQRIQGFMVPLDAKPTQTHFILTSVPLTCSFCTPGGPESMVEVKAKTPVRYSLEPVVVEGKFTVLPNDQYGLYYRVVDAVPVK